MWVILSEHKWVILAEHRGEWLERTLRDLVQPFPRHILLTFRWATPTSELDFASWLRDSPVRMAWEFRSMNTVDLLVSHGTLVTMDAKSRVIEDGAIAIRDGSFAA